MTNTAFYRSTPTDIVLMFDSSLNSEVAVLKPGNKVQFNATLFGLGRRGSPHVMNLWSVKDLGGNDLKMKENENRKQQNNTPDCI